MKLDLYHTVLGVVVGIHHQETPDDFTEVNSSLKVDLSHPHKTDVCMKEHP